MKRLNDGKPWGGWSVVPRAPVVVSAPEEAMGRYLKIKISYKRKINTRGIVNVFLVGWTI